jgi:hypothetical protein
MKLNKYQCDICTREFTPAADELGNLQVLIQIGHARFEPPHQKFEWQHVCQVCKTKLGLAVERIVNEATAPEVKEVPR